MNIVTATESCVGVPKISWTKEHRTQCQALISDFQPFLTQNTLTKVIKLSGHTIRFLIIDKARHIVSSLGSYPNDPPQLPVEHLQTMSRKTGWKLLPYLRPSLCKKSGHSSQMVKVCCPDLAKRIISSCFAFFHLLKKNEKLILQL